MDENQTELPRVPSQRQALHVIILTMLMLFVAGSIAYLLKLAKTEVFLFELFIIVPAFIFVLQKKLSLRETFRLRPINANIFIISIIIGLLVTVLADEADRLMSLIFPMPEMLSNAIKDTLDIKTVSDFIIIVFSAVFLAAVCEELLFRGFLQVSFEKSFDVTKAIMLTALVFAIIHFNPWWTIQLIVFSIFLGVLAWKSDSIIPSMLVHGMNNGIALLFANFGETHLKWYFWKEHVHPVIIIVSVLALYYGIKQFYKYCEEYNGDNSFHQDWNHPVN